MLNGDEDSVLYVNVGVCVCALFVQTMLYSGAPL